MNALPSLLIALSLASLAQAAQPTYPHLALADGRQLHDVTIKSFDQASGKFLIIADGKAQLIPAAQLPAALTAQLKNNLPDSGRSTNIQATLPAQTEAQKASILAARANAAERHARELAQPVIVTPPAPAPEPKPTVYPYYPIYYSNYASHSGSPFCWKDEEERRRDEDYRRRTSTPTTITPALKINVLPGGAVRNTTSVK